MHGDESSDPRLTAEESAIAAAGYELYDAYDSTGAANGHAATFRDRWGRAVKVTTNPAAGEFKYRIWTASESTDGS